MFSVTGRRSKACAGGDEPKHGHRAPHATILAPIDHRCGGPCRAQDSLWAARRAGQLSLEIIRVGNKVPFLANSGTSLLPAVDRRLNPRDIATRLYIGAHCRRKDVRNSCALQYMAGAEVQDILEPGHQSRKH